jgi:hypothetical protein
MPDMTIAEAARVLGYSADTIRRGVVKGAGPLAELLRDAGRKTNEGQWIVCLSDDQIARHRKPGISQPMPPQGPPAYAGPSQPPALESNGTENAEEVLRERIVGLEQRLADRDAEIVRIRTDLAQHNNVHRAQLAEQADKHRAERVELLAGAAAERERLLTLLERATVRPGLLERLLAVVLPHRS